MFYSPNKEPLITVRESFDKLLRFKPDVMPIRIDTQPPTEVPVYDVETKTHETLLVSEAGPWVCVDFEDGEKFAIWKATGMCYRLDKHGAVEDEPIEV